jgi:hypothetical protein
MAATTKATAGTIRNQRDHPVSLMPTKHPSHNVTDAGATAAPVVSTT